MILSRAQNDLIILSNLLALIMLIQIWFLKDRLVLKTTPRSTRMGVILVIDLRLFK